MRRSRATALLNTVTMQNVVCATMTVQMDSGTPRIVRNRLFSAMPVMMPGSAIGRITSRFTVFLPKNEKRCRANASMVPRMRARIDEISATRALVATASSAPSLRNALPPPLEREPPAGGAR